MKSVRIWSLKWIRRDTEYSFVFGPNVGKCWLEKYGRTLFTQFTWQEMLVPIRVRVCYTALWNSKYWYSHVGWTVFFSKRKLVSGYLRSKLHTCFYGISLLSICRKRLAQSFVAFWSVFKKLWSCKVLNLAWVTSCPQMGKTFHTCFLHIFVQSMKKEPSAKSYGIFDYFSQTYETTKSWMIKLPFD